MFIATLHAERAKEMSLLLPPPPHSKVHTIFTPKEWSGFTEVTIHGTINDSMTEKH